MPTTHDMTGTTRREIQRCLHWLHRDQRSNGNGYGRRISVVVGRGIRTTAWGDELEIRDTETNRLRRPRWWERAKHSEKQRLLSFPLFRSLTVQHVYCQGGEYDIELQSNPNPNISDQVLFFGNSRRDSQWFIRAIRIHDVGARNADGASPPPNDRTRAFTVLNESAVRATARVSSWGVEIQVCAGPDSDEAAPTNRDSCYDDACDNNACNVAEPVCEVPGPYGIPVRASATNDDDWMMCGDEGISGRRSRDIDDAVPRRGTSRYEPPVIIDQTNSVCNWLEHASPDQRHAFSHVNGNTEDVRVFFADLVSAALRGNGLAEAPNRYVYTRDTNAHIGYNLTFETRSTNSERHCFSLDLITGYRWSFWVDDLSQITTPGNIPSEPTCEAAPRSFSPDPSPPTSPDCNPPIVIGPADSVCAWLEQATSELQAEFNEVNGDARAVELFFAGLAEAALDDGGWVEEPDRRVYSTRNELVGYNLTIEEQGDHLRQYHVSMDMIDGHRRVFALDDISHIFTPNFPHGHARPEVDLNMGRFRSAFGLPVAQVRSETGDESTWLTPDRPGTAEKCERSQLLQDEVTRQIALQRFAVRPGRPRTRVERANQLREAYGGGPGGDVIAFEVDIRGNHYG